MVQQSSDPYARFSTPVKEAPTVRERAAEANLGQTQTSTARGQADLPYIAPTAAEQLERLRLQNEELQRQLDKAKKGTPLEGDDKTKFETDVDAFARLDRALQNFNPDFVGTILDFPGRAESALQKYVSSDIGTPGQAAFWQEMNLLDMLVRNKYFGASLTGNEKQAYAETTISPGMTPKSALDNLRARRDLLLKGIQRRVGSLRAGGYNPAQINAALGEYVPVMNPRWMSAENERLLGEYASQKDFDPAVYTKMLLEMGDANGLRIDPAQAEAAANAVLEKREQGQTKFGGEAVYKDLTQPDEDKAAAATAAGGPGGGGPEGGDGLGWGETLGSAAINFIPSVASEVGSIFDAITSPIQTATSIGALGGALLSKMGVADFDESSADALGQYYVNKYGSMEGFKRELASNPASILADAAVLLTGGAAAATKLGLPAKIAKLGRKAETAQRIAGQIARNVDPITAATNIFTKAVPAVTSKAAQIAGRTTAGALGMTTGVGGDSIRRAADVGFERGRAGERTPREVNFVEQMRGGGNLDDVVSQAEDLLRDQQEAASQAYKAGMVDVSKDATVLTFDGIDDTLSKLRDRAYYGNQIRNPTAAKVYEDVKAKVDEWRDLDPAQYHTPEGMDALKQNIGGIIDNLAANGDRAALSIASGVYDKVRNSIAKQVPGYAKVMKNYEDAANNIRDIRHTFSLRPGANVDTKLRKLQSLMRNNVNTSFAYRKQLAETMGAPDQIRVSAPRQTGAPKTKEQLLAEYAPQSGEDLLDTLAAQNLSSWEPRGLQRLTSGAAIGSGLTGIGLEALPMVADVPGYLSPFNLATVPLTMPRVVGEGAYFGGRAAGAAGRMLEPVTSRIGSAGSWLAEKQRQYRTPFLLAGPTAMALEASQGQPEVVEETEEFFVLSDGTKVRKPKAEPMAYGGLMAKYGVR